MVHLYKKLKCVFFVRTLELVEKEAWPQNGHKLATVTIEAIEKISAEFYAGSYFISLIK